MNMKPFMVTASMVILMGWGLIPGDAFADSGVKGHHGPPPEAYTACDQKNAGDAAEFVSPRGDVVTGICEKEGDLLVLRPYNSKSGSPEMKNRGTHKGPPPEAYTACDQKSAGDRGQFISSRGEPIAGTCEYEGNRLVLRPDNPPAR